MASTTVEDVLRDCAPHVLAVMVRRHRDFQRCEDAVQEALLAASLAWPQDGIPTNPQGWLSTAATRRLIDSVRADQSRRHREQRDALLAGTAATMITRSTKTPARSRKRNRRSFKPPATPSPSPNATTTSGAPPESITLTVE